MNLFDFFSKFTHKTNTRNWIETTATFTGRRNKAAARTKAGFHELDYYEYEITYDVDGKRKRAWYTFYPLPDPEPGEIQGNHMRIKYNKHRPYIVEYAEENENEKDINYK